MIQKMLSPIHFNARYEHVYVCSARENVVKNTLILPDAMVYPMKSRYLETLVNTEGDCGPPQMSPVLVIPTNFQRPFAPRQIKGPPLSPCEKCHKKGLYKLTFYNSL